MAVQHRALPCTLALFGTLLGIAAAAQAASAAGRCAVTANFSNEVVEVDVQVGLPLAVLHGNMTVANPTGQSGRVFLDPGLSRPWPVAAENTTIPLPPEDNFTAQFAVTVAVPRGEPPSSEVTLTVVLDATVWSEECGEFNATARALIRPKPYMGAMTTSASPAWKAVAPPKFTTTVRLIIERDSNLVRNESVLLFVVGPPGLTHDAPRALRMASSRAGGALAVVSVNLSFEHVAPGTHNVSFRAEPANSTPDDVIRGAAVRVFVPTPASESNLAAGVTIGGASSISAAAWIWWHARRREMG